MNIFLVEGASSGIGEAIANCLIDSGHQVIRTYNTGTIKNLVIEATDYEN